MCMLPHSPVFVTYQYFVQLISNTSLQYSLCYKMCMSQLTFSPSPALCGAEGPMQLSSPPFQMQMQPSQSLSHSHTPIFPTSSLNPEKVSSSSNSSGCKRKLPGHGIMAYIALTLLMDLSEWVSQIWHNIQ
jgi:hypothetical protein